MTRLALAAQAALWAAHRMDRISNETRPVSILLILPILSKTLNGCDSHSSVVGYPSLAWFASFAVSPRTDREIRQLREQSRGQSVLAACRVLTFFRIVEGFGHVSARVGTDRVLITPRRAIGLGTES